MANLEHLKKLKSGIRAYKRWLDTCQSIEQSTADHLHTKLSEKSIVEWNEWRKANPQIKIDLSTAYLREAKLRNIDLSNADLSNADLTDADLRGANLKNANLNYAILRGALLNGADLTNADFGGADLVNVRHDNTELDAAKFPWKRKRK